MLVTEILDLSLGQSQGRGSPREQYPFHKPEQNTSWGIFDRSGKMLRTGLSAEAAKAIAMRPDLVKKYGRLVARLA